MQTLDYPPVGAITLAYPESALRPDRLDANGNLPGRYTLCSWLACSRSGLCAV